MVKKKHSRLARTPEPGLADHEVDTRSESSPFASDIFSLYFQNEGPLYIHQSFVNRSTKLTSKCWPTVYGVPPRTIRFDDVALDAGHVLVYFLITGEYNSLKPKGESMDERHASEFATALHVADVAESYELPALRDLATIEIQKLGDKLTMFSVIHIMEEASQTVIHIPEVAAYIRSRIQDFCNIPTRAAGEEVLSAWGTPDTIAKLVLKSVVEKNLQELPVGEPSPQGVDREETAPATTLGESIPIEKQEEEEALAEEAPAEEAPAEEAPAEEAPAEEAPAEEAPAEEAPAEEAPAEEAPAEEAPAEEAPAEEAPAEAEPEPEPQPETGPFDDREEKQPLSAQNVPHEDWAFGPVTTSKKKKKKKDKKAKVATHLENPVSSHDTHDLQLDCVSRSGHLTVNGDWKNCSNCRKFVQQLSYELARAEDIDAACSPPQER